MDPGRFFASSKMLIVAGKGGVGKTVVAATAATAATRLGMSALLVEVGGRADGGPLLGVDSIGYEPVEVSPSSTERGALHVRSITPDDALVEWLSLHGFRRLVGRMTRSGLLEVVATATPGIKDLLVLGKIKNLESSGRADLVVVDAPAAGHALGFLRAPATIRETARAGTIHRQATEALEMLSDRARCRVMLVTIPEETPVNELAETAFALEEEIGVHLTPLVANSVQPELAGLDAALADRLDAGELDGIMADRLDAGGLDPVLRDDLCRATRFRASRTALQVEQLARLHRLLPLDQLRLPQLFIPRLGPPEIDELATELLAQIEALPEPLA